MTRISFDTESASAPACDDCKRRTTYYLYFHARSGKYLCDACYDARIRADFAASSIDLDALREKQRREVAAEKRKARVVVEEG